MALYRHRPELISSLRNMIGSYVAGVSSSTGTIGADVTIVDSEYIKNVKVGDSCKIEGASRLKNGSINSNASAPVHVGVGVIGDEEQMMEDFMHVRGSFFEADPFVTSVREHITAKSDLGDLTLALLDGLS
jgi:hypothetical protein